MNNTPTNAAMILQLKPGHYPMIQKLHRYHIIITKHRKQIEEVYKMGKIKNRINKIVECLFWNVTTPSKILTKIIGVNREIFTTSDIRH